MKKEKRQFFLMFLMAMGIASVVGLASAKGFLQSIENMVADSLYQRAGAIPNDIKIIAIDEETLLRLGPYSDWDRGYFAELMKF